MPQKRSPTSYSSAVALLSGHSWSRQILRVLSGGISSATHVTRPSPTARLPKAIVEMIVGYLIHDVPSLRACSETCRSWYTSAFPHLHLTISASINRSFDPKLQWPNPIRSMHTLGLLPSAKKVQIHSGYLGDNFSPSLLGWRVLRHFSALTNVQELEIDHLDIPNFVPRIQRCFGHFLPTVRSLSLKAPEGSSRQIVYFVGWFQNLEDLSLRDINAYHHGGEPSGGKKLIPRFSPPLRGRLTIWHVNRDSVVRDMINLFEGIRFDYMDVFNSTAVPSLLYACAKTLRVVRLHPNDPLNTHTNLSPARDLNTIEISVASVDNALRIHPLQTHGSLDDLLSTLRSKSFSRVVMVYQETDFRGIKFGQPPDWPYLRHVPPMKEMVEASRHRERFELLRRACRTKSFELVLRANVWGPVAEYAVQMLEKAVAVEKRERGFDDFPSEPLVMYDPRRGFRLRADPRRPSVW